MHVLNLTENGRKRIFYIEIAVCYLTILAFMIMTPMMADDFNYAKMAQGAGSLAELFHQEYLQYMNWTGRSVAHIILRFVYYFNAVGLFNVLSAGVFTLMTLLIYANVERHERYDYRLYLLIVLMVWIFGTSFAETVLLKYASCNYLITGTIILGFITLFRHYMKSGVAGSWARAIGMFLFGVVAGWCNENTSGGAILLLFIWMIMFLIENRKNGSASKVQPWMLSGIAGMLVGFAFMILAPGNFVRAAYTEEEHSGIVGMIARIQKTTLAIGDEFFLLICAFVVILIVLRAQGRTWRDLQNMLLWGFIALATSYSLIMVASIQPRSMFGACIYLIIAVAQGFSDIKSGTMENGQEWYGDSASVSKSTGQKEAGTGVQAGNALYNLTYTVVTALISVMFCYMFFQYVDCGTDLGRIYREEVERDTYLRQQYEAGVTETMAPLLRPEFDNKYTAAYMLDMQPDPGYWINVEMTTYYGLTSITGVPREEWNEY